MIKISLKWLLEGIKLQKLSMQNLLQSPSKQLEDETPERLDHLSPDKYGKAAYVDLTYTPSKLKENVLYRETTTLKRVEESHSKVRELESLNIILEDKLSKIKQEKEGIESSLNTQIQMYKKLLSESQSKYEVRLKNLQMQFTEKMEQHIRDKEEQSKYAQAEKEALEDENERLQKIIDELTYKLNHSGDQNSGLLSQKQKLELQNKNLRQELDAALKNHEDEQKQAKGSYEKLSRQKFQSQVSLRQKIDENNLQKERQLDSLKKQHWEELQKIQNQRAADNILKNEEVKEITQAFNNETDRLNKNVEEKEAAIEELHSCLNQEKQKVLSLTRNYQAEINTLTHEKNRYKEELTLSHAENENLIKSLADHRALYESDRCRMAADINHLSKQLEDTYLSLTSEKEKNVLLKTSVDRELMAVHHERSRIHRTSDDNIVLSRETRNLRQLLIESSSELEKCKEEFIKMGRERDILLIKLRELGHENEALYLIQQEREIASTGWKDSYFRKPTY